MKAFFLLILVLPLSAHAAEECRSPPGETFPEAKARLSRKILLAGLRYAREHSHPVTGFVEDTVGNYAELPPSPRVRASISSTGFLMALVADLYRKGMVSREEALRYCERPLEAVLKKKSADSAAALERSRTGAPDPHLDLTYQGWFAHFVDWETGDRWKDSATNLGVEYATTDSTWFLAGGIVCAESFPNTGIPQKLDEILRAVNFRDLLTDGGARKDKLTLSMAYVPDDTNGGNIPKRVGYSEAQWDIYQHSWLVYLLGMGAPRADFRLPPESWAAWQRSGIRLALPGSPLDGEVLYGDRRALFSHYFPSVFLSPKKIREACSIDYFHNSQVATRFNREASLADTSSATFRSGLWGLDAGPNPVITKLQPGAKLTVGLPDTVRYEVNSPYKRQGSACPACAVAASMFEPDLVLHDLRAWCDDENFGGKIWGRYGPANGINLDYGWISPYALSGIVGPMALSVANLGDTTRVWDLFMQYPAVQRGLARAARAPRPAQGCLVPEAKRIRGGQRSTSPP